MNPEQALFLRDHLVACLRLEHPLTRRVIEAIPPAKQDYRPDDIGRSAIDLAWHIVAAEHRFMDAVVNGVFDLTGSGRPSALSTPTAISSWYSETFLADIQRVKAMSSDQLLKIVDFRGLFQLPAVAYLQSVMGHSIHHRGQLSMVLRPMGALVPAIYGESYDSAQAKSGA